VARAPVRAVLLLCSLVFLARAAGEMTHSLERALALFVFVVFCFCHATRPVLRRQWGTLLLGAVLLAASAFPLQPDPPIAVAALAVALVGLWFVVRGAGIEPSDLPAHVLTVVGFSLLLLLSRTLPEAWYLGRWLSRVASAVGSLVTGTPIDFRPTYCGLSITGLLVLFWAARWLYGRRRQWRDLVVPITLTLVAQVFYLVFAVLILHLLLPLTHSTAAQSAAQAPWYDDFELVSRFRRMVVRLGLVPLVTRSLPWNLPFLLFLLNVPIVFWGVGRAPETSEWMMPFARQWRKAAAAVLSFAASVLLLCCLPLKGLPPQSKPVVFYEKGFLNWEVPRWGEYGPLSVGMFGNLPRYAESLGLANRRVPAITSASLADASALVIINLNHPLPTTSTAAIWDFVAQGGTLLVLGDHTPYDESGRVFVNELLAPTSIAFNLDSAICPVGGWLHCYGFQWHPLTVGLGDERNEAGIVTGASLAIRWPAYPIVLGRHGFEDEGNLFKPDHAYLGNMTFDTSEPLGDTVLVAAQRFGRGKVLVFGDTSSFVNGIVVGTHEFVGRVLRWIAIPERSVTRPIGSAAAVVLLAVALSLLFVRNLPGRWTLLALSLIAAVVPTAVRQYWVAVSHQPLRGGIAYLDQYHLPMASEEGWRDDGLMGLQMNLMRGGLLAFNLHRFDERTLGEARLLAIVAPGRRFSQSDIRTIRHYLEGGGTVVLSVGSEESYASRRLLRAFDIEIENMPLGYFRVPSPALAGLEAMFFEGWPVRDHSGEAEIISAHGQEPLIVVKPCGEGQLVVIGDSGFLLNKNLEGEKSYNETNINFLKTLLEYLEVIGRK